MRVNLRRGLLRLWLVLSLLWIALVGVYSADTVITNVELIWPASSSGQENIVEPAVSGVDWEARLNGSASTSSEFLRRLVDEILPGDFDREQARRHDEQGAPNDLVLAGMAALAPPLALLAAIFVSLWVAAGFALGQHAAHRRVH